MKKTLLAFVAALLLAAPLSAGQLQAAERFITVASTTSTKNSGLLDFLLPKFQAESGIEVRVVAVGTGKALQQARDGDADVLLVHAKGREEQFVAEGYGVERFDVMYNDFVIVGPQSDPAGVAGLSDAQAALTRIAEAEATFASRGDDSGTHTKERNLWKAAGVDIQSASGGWYRETGSGMGATLNTGIGMDAYVLTDRATWIAFENKGGHEVLVEGDPQLFNQYGVILVNPDKHPHVKTELGQSFIDWLTGETGQALIAEYRLNGQQLFFPNARKGQS
ncbi:tupA [Symbiodinium necroappetens]|uniref:TupA protein n=1 Tax=Symbiodinium necroappetens TaxID=1628268 RepID=A0A813AGP3_9DINO|nr:tupA [Symbiodinium necroappetens]